MKIFLYTCISISVTCLALQSAPSFGQARTTEAATVQQVGQQEISKDVVINRFKQIGQESREIGLLDSKLRSLQFLPATAEKNYWGRTATYQRIVEGIPEHLIQGIYVQDYVKQNSKDTAGLAQVTLTSSSGTTQTYSFYLVAPGGDFKKLQEYAVTNGAVTLQHSWWTCVECQLPKVGGECAVAAATCAVTAETVVGYLACVGVSCGGSLLAAGACCACNGSGWCSWAVGSCSESAQCSGTSGGGTSGGVVVPPACERCCEYDPKKGHCTKCVSGREVCP
jgi:hypothetical protein